MEKLRKKAFKELAKMAARKYPGEIILKSNKIYQNQTIKIAMTNAKIKSINQLSHLHEKIEGIFYDLEEMPRSYLSKKIEKKFDSLLENIAAFENEVYRECQNIRPKNKIAV